MKISAEAVRALAELAELELEPAELERMRRELEAILGYVEQLDELDTRDVPPTAHVLDVAAPLRPDEATGALPVAEAVRNAPRHDRSSMIVPRVLE